MSPKGILITFLVVSLLLIGIMFLAVDGRNNSVLDRFKTLEEEFQEANESTQEKIDSLAVVLEKTANPNLEILKELEGKAAELLTHIELLKKEYIADQDKNETPDYEELDKHKNDILFDVSNNTYSEKGKQFIVKIEAYESAVKLIDLKFVKIDTKSFKLREIIKDKDWLSYNFKDFPIIASYTKLVSMENDIKSKQKEIITAVLTNK